MLRVGSDEEVGATVSTRGLRVGRLGSVDRY